MAIEVHKIVNTSGDASIGFYAAAQSYLISDYFAEVRMVDTHSFDFIDGDGNVVCNIKWAGLPVTLTAYHFDGTSGAVDLASSNNYLIYVYKCSNAVMFVFGDFSATSPNVGTNGIIIFTKDTNGKTGVIAAENVPTSPQFRTSVYTDTGTMPAITTAWNASNQTQFIDIPTHPAAGAINYFPNAYYMPLGQLYNMGYGKFISDEKTYMTNGYFAVLDE